MLLGGILYKPFQALMLRHLVTIDVMLGIFTNGLNLVGSDADSLLEKGDDFLKKLFIGPDTIFSGKVPILDANIFGSRDTG